jgi:hypothetical protein
VVVKVEIKTVSDVAQLAGEVEKGCGEGGGGRTSLEVGLKDTSPQKNSCRLRSAPNFREEVERKGCGRH